MTSYRIAALLASTATIAIIAAWQSNAIAPSESPATALEKSAPGPETPPQESAMQITNLHRAIVQQSGWLNVSRPLTAEDLKGRIILLDFWTFCCINCIHIIPDLQFLEHRFGDDLAVIGVHSAKFKNEQDSENIRQAILRYGIAHPVVNDFDFSTWQRFGVRAWPTLVLINPAGIIEAVYSGEGHREELERDIERLQRKYAGTLNRDTLPLALEKDKTPPSILSFPGKIAYTENFDGKPALFISDSSHHRIVVAGLDGTITQTIGAGTPGREDGDFAHARFNGPQGLAYADRALYVADTQNHLLRKIDFASGIVETLAGTGTQGSERAARNAHALKTPLASPWDVAFYPDTSHLAIAMAGTHQIWSYDTKEKTVSVIAGNGRESIDDGALTVNSLSQPSGLSVLGDRLYFVDSETSSLRMLEKGEVKTLIGTGLFDFGYQEGPRGKGLLQHPLGLFADESGIYIADSYNHSIRRYDPKTGALSNFAGHGARGKDEGTPEKAAFNEPNDIQKIGGVFYVADTNNNAIRVIDPAKNEVRSLGLAEPAREAPVEFSATLPNLEMLPEIALAGEKPATLHLALASGWHINDEAPSYLALFAVEGDAHILTASFNRDALKKGAAQLPPLVAGKKYRLQGTLYYCENKEGAQCLIKSVDGTVKTAKDGKNTLTVGVN